VPNWFRRKKDDADPAAIFTELRDLVLLEPLPEPGTWVALMEMGTAGGVASVVAASDGTTSLYTSTGGGLIGAGDHDSVAEANRAFLATIEELRAVIPATDAYPLPGEGEIRFSVRWPDGTQGSAVAEDEILASGGHPLSAAFAAGQDVITAMREIEERGD
jgi:hypothetical protein